MICRQPILKTNINSIGINILASATFIFHIINYILNINIMSFIRR